MANAVTGFYQTLVAALDEASQVLAPTWNAAQSVYLDVDPNTPAEIGQTLNVVIPQDPTNSVTDIGTGNLIISDANADVKPIVFNRHPAYSIVIKNFEQFNTPQSLRTKFLDGALKGIKTHINRQITALFTTANFTTNTAIAATGGKVTTVQFLQGQAVLLDQNVPAANDPDNMSFLVGSVPYTKITGDADWTSAQIAGNTRAEAIHETGVMPTSYGCTLKVDQNMPVSGTSPSRTWTGAYLHRWAIALATRPLPQPDGKVVEYMYKDFFGIPVRIQFGYNQVFDGTVLSVDAGYGLAVVRENMGQLFTIAE